MATFVDGIEFKGDDFKAAPRYEWRILNMTSAIRSGKTARVCLPDCEYYKKDLDGAPLCYDECRYFIFDSHEVKEGDPLVFVLFATRESDPNSGVAEWVTEDYLITLLGKKQVAKMIEAYLSLESTDVKIN